MAIEHDEALKRHYEARHIKHRNSALESTSLVAMQEVLPEDDEAGKPMYLARLEKGAEQWQFVNDTLKTLYGIHPSLYAYLWITTFTDNRRPEITLEIMQQYEQSSLSTVTLTEALSEEQLRTLIAPRFVERRRM